MPLPHRNAGTLADFGQIKNLPNKLADHGITDVYIDEEHQTIHIGDKEINVSPYRPGGVTTEQLHDGSVTNIKLADNSVSHEKLSQDLQDKIADVDHNAADISALEAEQVTQNNKIAVLESGTVPTTKVEFKDAAGIIQNYLELNDSDNRLNLKNGFNLQDDTGTWKNGLVGLEENDFKWRSKDGLFVTEKDNAAYIGGKYKIATFDGLMSKNYFRLIYFVDFATINNYSSVTMHPGGDCHCRMYLADDAPSFIQQAVISFTVEGLLNNASLMVALAYKTHNNQYKHVYKDVKNGRNYIVFDAMFTHLVNEGDLLFDPSNVTNDVTFKDFHVSISDSATIEPAIGDLVDASNIVNGGVITEQGEGWVKFSNGFLVSFGVDLVQSGQSKAFINYPKPYKVAPIVSVTTLDPAILVGLGGEAFASTANFAAYRTQHTEYAAKFAWIAIGWG